MICPECGKEMEPGFIRGGCYYLTWTEKMRRSDIGGDRLGGANFNRGAHMPAFRCMDCELILAKYVSHDKKVVEEHLSGSSITYEKRLGQDKN